MKKLFSQRKGIKPVRSTFQMDFMDGDLRSRLWDVVTKTYLENITLGYPLTYEVNYSMRTFVERIWHEYFKEPIDTINPYWPTTLLAIHTYFFTCDWNEVYDFIEFAHAASPSPWKSSSASFTARCNQVLEEELSGFRFVSGDITAITAEEEIDEIEQATNLADTFRPVTEHIRQAMRLLSDRKNPDYRNSIKESISAVEALCQLISKSNKSTLGDALKKIEPKLKLHPAMKDAFLKLYGYTSDAEGIRHALLDESSLRFEDAKYMLVTCSAFINYLIAKTP